MAAVMDSLTQTITPQLTKQISEMLGMDDSQVTQGINIAAPLVLAALGNKVSTAKGADEVLGSLKHNVANPVDAAVNGESDALLQKLFGIGAPKAASWIENTTGIRIAPLLPFAAPLVMRAFQNVTKSQALDSAGLTALLKNENETYARAQPQLASEINAALDASANVNERAARLRAQFTDAEWNTLATTPALAGYAVMMSSLSGPVGINKEMAALLEAMVDYGSAAEPDSLVGIVSREVTTPEQITALGANRENALNLTRDACLEALRILTEKETHAETLAYKAFVVNVATRVASAAIDGGVMSIGGKPITEEEQMTLDLIAAALAYQP